MSFVLKRFKLVGAFAALSVCFAALAGTGCPPSGNAQTGSCCAANGTCTVTAQSDCSTGTWTAGATCTPNPCTAAPSPVTPQLYVANFLGNGILSWLNPSTINGNIAPDTNITGPQTSLINPVDMVVTSSGILLSVNAGAVPPSITVYPGASTANGNVVPSRIVQGTNTGMNAPATIAISAANDLAFVANNTGTFDINVYSGASTSGFLGNLPPARTIKSSALKNPIGINFGANDDLYVANAGNNNIIVFANASTRNGSISPDRTLTNAVFTGLFDCFVDGSDNLYVVNGNGGGANKNKVFVIKSASTLNGPVTIDSTLTVTGAVSLGAIAVDKNKVGYIVEGTGGIDVYDAVDTKNGSFSPDRIITGASTQLSGPIRLFLVE